MRVDVSGMVHGAVDDKLLGEKVKEGRRGKGRKEKKRVMVSKEGVLRGNGRE